MTFDQGEYTSDCCTAAHELKITIHELKQLQKKLDILISALSDTCLSDYPEAKQALKEINELDE